MAKVNRIYNSRFVVIITVILLLILLYYLGVLKPVDGAISFVLRPFQSVASSITSGFKNITDPFSSVMSLQTENEDLRQKNNELNIRISELQNYISEQFQINIQQEFLVSKNLEFVSARVTGKSSDLSFRTLIIDKGINNGIKVGQPAVINEGVLIGIVQKTEINHSEILLINDNRSTINSQVQNDNQTSGIVYGQFSSSLSMELIPQGDPIEINDLIVTADDDEVPSGLIIGRVVEVNNSPGELFQTALILPLAKLENISVVSIITSSL
ncbi:rod shape-determining protein MreC [Patescibacteria group bacterium]